MVSLDKDAVSCDFAEYYGIYNFEELGVRKAAIFAAGLPASSRIIRKMSGQKIDQNTALMALVVDDLNTLIWMQTKDGKRGRRRPKSIYKLLTGEVDKSKVKAFSTPEAFEKAKRKLLEEG